MIVPVKSASALLVADLIAIAILPASISESESVKFTANACVKLVVFESSAGLTSVPAGSVSSTDSDVERVPTGSASLYFTVTAWPGTARISSSASLDAVPSMLNVPSNTPVSAPVSVNVTEIPVVSDGLVTSAETVPTFARLYETTNSALPEDAANAWMVIAPVAALNTDRL